MTSNVPHGNITVNLDLPCGHGLALPIGKNAPMKNRIKEFREARGFTQGQLAERSGVDTSYISRLETGKRGRGKGGKGGPTYAILAAISGALAVPIGELVDLDEAGLTDALDDDTHLIPVLSQISAGTFRPQDGVREADIERHIKVSHLPRGDWFALEVDGDSMDLVAPSGSVVIVNRAEHSLIDGKHYVFSLDDGAATFKQYRADPEPMLVPQSTNRNHYAVPVGERELYVFGRVRRVITDL